MVKVVKVVDSQEVYDYNHGCFEFTGSRYNNNVHVFDGNICDMMIIMITTILTKC